jgi:hypothetical protein
MGDDFFDAFEGGISVDWSKIDEVELTRLVNKLEDQEAEAIFAELKRVIETNNRNKAIVKTTLTVLQTAVKLGAKLV